jgi:hypothetical protein
MGSEPFFIGYSVQNNRIAHARNIRTGLPPADSGLGNIEGREPDSIVRLCVNAVNVYQHQASKQDQFIHLFIFFEVETLICIIEVIKWLEAGSPKTEDTNDTFYGMGRFMESVQVFSKFQFYEKSALFSSSSSTSTSISNFRTSDFRLRTSNIKHPTSHIPHLKADQDAPYEP